MIMQLIAAMAGTIAFSVLFSVPRKYYIYCGLIGGAGWGVYLALTEYIGCGKTTSIFFATVLIMLLSRFFAVYKQCPATVFIPGILPLIPGTSIYQTVYYLVNNQLQESLVQGLAAIKMVGAIILAIALVFELPSGMFRFFHIKRNNY